MNGLTGKIAVITGGTQGLGAAIARLFADRGASGIVTCGRSEAKGRARAQEIQDATGAKVVFVAADLGNVEDCRAVIAKADAEFGRVDVLVNAAGITDRGTILDTSPELFDKIFNVKNGGIGYGKVSTKLKNRAAIIKKTNAIKKLIASGKIKPPAK